MGRLKSDDILKLNKAGLSSDLIDKLIDIDNASFQQKEKPEQKKNPGQDTEQPERQTAAEILSGLFEPEEKKKEE